MPLDPIDTPQPLLDVAYLAMPYSHPEESVRVARTQVADYFAALCAHKDWAVFSPITHGPRLEKYLPEYLRTAHGWWMRQCLPMLAVADVLILLPIPGWRESRGVQMELAFAEDAGIQVLVIQSEFYNCEAIGAEEMAEHNWRLAW